MATTLAGHTYTATAIHHGVLRRERMTVNALCLARVAVSAVSSAISRIVQGGTDAKVVRSVVGRVAVGPMAHLLPVRDGAVERLVDEAVDPSRVALPVEVQHDLVVAVLVSAGSQNTSTSGVHASQRVIADTINRPHSSKVGDLIAGKPADGKPFLHTSHFTLMMS